jgi:hypothetical protein
VFAQLLQERIADFQNVSFLRLRRPMCGSGYALPETRDYFIGAMPLTAWRRGKLSELSCGALMLDPEAKGHSPK